ncbi:glycosyltransferase [Reyranella sp.]|uniref:glycosyltransferase n=1 Tax=Reyranella sp. TaxID=1929291 RepID=UPI003D0D8D74
MPNVLFVHNGAPGRFAFLAAALRERGWTGALINGPTGTDLEGMASIRWRPSGPQQGSPRRLVRQAESQLVAGAGGAEAAMELRRNGFLPDLIVGHPSWGEMLFLREVFPDTPQIQVGEFYYRTQGANFNFDPEFSAPSLEAAMVQQAGNAAFALSFAQATRIVAPTPYQASTYPGVFQPLIRVVHEGVDTQAARPFPQTQLTLRDGTILDRSTPVITFINRRFEPLRGFHVFMRALPRFLSEVPDAHVLMVGADDPDTYGRPPPEGSWKQRLLGEVGDRLDPARVHWVGPLPYEQLLYVFAASWAHVYLTYPFALSWSLLDAMACGCLIIGSDTAPVRDVVRHEENGLLVPFFDVDALAAQLAEACRKPERFRRLRDNARATAVAEYDRATVCLPKWLDVVDEVLAEQPPLKGHK